CARYKNYYGSSYRYYAMDYW
nr:immunoglobulin heavy chain junction region [Mus musculus]MBK4184220.1 immunoglobulin heavy chain junction region [Mus musculus]MBK4184221.1 immunoglobulin heavy chain junction region [Mus musculus]MBK4184222.1 immunoglobulin heavy chain junction region [Mus musculus]MBK4184223.1 immunoglobulin heavy chain junction region [Mus musculus]